MFPNGAVVVRTIPRARVAPKARRGCERSLFRLPDLSLEAVMDSEHPVPAGIRQSLGEVVIEWGRVEAIIAEFLSYLLQADPGAMYVLNQEVGSGTQIKWD